MAASRRPNQADQAAAFGARVRRLRRQQKLTQDQLAGRVPMSGANLSRIENGMQGTPSDAVIERIANALGISVKELLEGAAGPMGDFERQVLTELRDLRAGIGRLEKAAEKPPRPQGS